MGADQNLVYGGVWLVFGGVFWDGWPGFWPGGGPWYLVILEGTLGVDYGNYGFILDIF